jgi:probable addiction module antidote protein
MKTDKWDAAEDMDTKEDVIAYFEAALEENDTEFLLEALDDIARSKGMAKIIKEMGLQRKDTPEKNPSFAVVAKVLDTLGYRINIQQKKAS